MGAIYENAYCTLAATNGIGGSFDLLPDNLNAGSDELLRLPCDLNDKSKGHELWRKSFKNWPHALDTRAWVVQERILSRRIIHFSLDMIYIQCDLETKGVNRQLVHNWVEVDTHLRLRLLDVHNHALYDAEGRDDLIRRLLEGVDDIWVCFGRVDVLWPEIVKKNSRCNLTPPSDKLIALSGLTQSIRVRTGIFYSFGSWLGVENELIPKHLTWILAGGRSVLRASIIRAPSWSRAAVEGEIEF